VCNCRFRPPPYCPKLSNLYQPMHLVLATVPGYLAAVQDWNQAGLCGPGGHRDSRCTNRVRSQVRTGLWFHFKVPKTLAAISI